MSQLTTYTIRSKNSSNVWLFKYHLDGTLAMFEVLDGLLDEKQINWLFRLGYFPYMETQIKDWRAKLKVNFEVVVGEPLLDFENLWKLYDHKVAKFHAEKAFKKLKEADIIKCFLCIPGYKKYLAKSKIAQAHLATFINGRYYEDDYTKVN